MAGARGGAGGRRGLAALAGRAGGEEGGPGEFAGVVHVVFSTECNEYFDWQSAGLIHSHKVAYEAAGLEPCPITRLVACDNPNYAIPQLPEYPFAHVHMHPNFKNYQGDAYSAYNKPGSVMHWLENGDTAGAEWVVIIDADMIILKPFLMEKLHPRPKQPISAYYGYLQGVEPDVYMGVKAQLVEPRKNPDVPYSKIGGFAVHHIGELPELSREWLNLSAAVRKDPDSWAHTGDIFNCPEQDQNPGCKGKECGCKSPPWISEMYGYVFASAVVGVHHQVNNKVMLYPDNMPASLDKEWPLVMHYGLTYHMNLKSGYSWSFDKHWYQNRDMISCPGQLFMQPPEKSDLKTEGLTVFQLSAQDLAWQTAQGLHNGLVAYHETHCPGQEPVQIPLQLFKCEKDTNFVLTCNPVKMPDTEPKKPARGSEAILRGGQAAGGGGGGREGGGAPRAPREATGGEGEKDLGYQDYDAAKGGSGAKDNSGLSDKGGTETGVARSPGATDDMEKPKATNQRERERRTPRHTTPDVAAHPRVRKEAPRVTPDSRTRTTATQDSSRRGESSPNRGADSLYNFKFYMIAVWAFAFLGIVAYSRDFRRRRTVSRRPGMRRLPLS